MSVTQPKKYISCAHDVVSEWQQLYTLLNLDCALVVAKILRSSARFTSIFSCCAERVPGSACKPDTHRPVRWTSQTAASSIEKVLFSSHRLSPTRHRSETCDCQPMKRHQPVDQLRDQFLHVAKGSLPAPIPNFMTTEIQGELRQSSRVLSLGETPYHRHHFEPL